MTKEDFSITYENNIFYCTKNNTKWISVDGKKWYGEEKRIEELEKENAELKEDNDARKFAMAMSERVEKQLRKENAELKKENQKWKDGIALKDEEIGCIETDFNTFKSKAKEIIKTFLLWENDWHNKTESKYELLKQAEQFLKDSEVEK